MTRQRDTGDRDIYYGGLQRIDIPAVDTLEPYLQGLDPKHWIGYWISITDPTIIANHACAVNKRQYNQAQDTPFGSGYLASVFGLHEDTQAADELLEGNLQLDTEQIPFPKTLDITQELGNSFISNRQKYQQQLRWTNLYPLIE